MQSMFRRTTVFALALAALGSIPGVRADILSDILSAATAARDRATQARDNAAAARDRAAQARDNAAAARDTAIEMRDTMRSGLDSLTDQMNTAIANAVTELQQQVQDEYAGLDAFVSGGEAEPFRQNLLRLINDTSLLLGTLYDTAGLEHSRVNFEPLTNVLSALPANSLYPLYRTMAVDSDLFHAGGFVDQMEEAITDLQSVGVVFVEPDCEEDGPVLDQEICDCGNILPVLPQLKRASSNLRRAAAGLKLVGKALEAFGETHLHRKAGVWGWVGISIEENRRKKVGLFLESAGESIQTINEFVHSRIQHCALIAIADEQRARDLEILANQTKILKLLDSQSTGPQP